MEINTLKIINKKWNKKSVSGRRIYFPFWKTLTWSTPCQRADVRGRVQTKDRRDSTMGGSCLYLALTKVIKQRVFDQITVYRPLALLKLLPLRPNTLQ